MKEKAYIVPKPVSSSFKKFSCFLNFQQPKDHFQKILSKELAKETQLSFEIKKEDLPEFCLFIQAFDEPENPEEIFEKIEFIQKAEIPFVIFLMGEEYPVTPKMINREKGAAIEKTRKKLRELYPQQTFEFNSDQEMLDRFHSAITGKNIFEIKIKSLSLKNIGLFENVRFDLDPEETIFIGVNGTGKTTLLRAMALSLISNGNKEVQEKLIASLLRIEKRNSSRKKGEIEIIYTINKEKFNNKISFLVNDNGEIEIDSNKNNPLFQGAYLKLLILGFSQRRGLPPSEKEKKPLIEINPPKVKDLLPLIHNREEEHLHSFISWIANLNNAVQNGDTDKKDLIKKAFRIFSDIADQEIQFLETVNVDPLEVWITTQESPGGIPFQLASQGCQTVMGWCGYLLQRMFEAYPDRKNFFELPAIVIIDEIDAFLHPKWQKNILTVLRNHFPQTQFIASTHSPLILDGLEKGKLIHLHQTDSGKINPKTNDFDIWAWSYADIISRFFETDQDPLDKEKDLEEKIRRLSQISKRTETEEEELDEAELIYERIQESRRAKSELTATFHELAQKRKTLDDLIDKYTELTKTE